MCYCRGEVRNTVPNGALQGYRGCIIWSVVLSMIGSMFFGQLRLPSLKSEVEEAIQVYIDKVDGARVYSVAT
jgi:hypothetical protein